jgi:prevent-host-death family protein
MTIVMTMEGDEVMRTIKASEFKAKCLKLMDEVAATGEPLVITKSGKPVAQLGPVAREQRSLWGLHKGQIEILGDIIEPIDVDWEANL